MVKQLKFWALAASLMTMTACVSAIPVVREADMMISGAIGGHLHPPQHFVDDRSWLEQGVVIKRVDAQTVGPTCNLYGNFMDMFVAECVKSFEDGSILMVLPTCPDFSRHYCDTAETHGWGHVYQAKTDTALNHDGWGRFRQPKTASKVT
ncbi:MAG: hypothetical protein ABJH52_14120 [Henriciella sp.]